MDKRVPLFMTGKWGLNRIVQRAWTTDDDGTGRAGYCIRLWPTHRCVVIQPLRFRKSWIPAGHPDSIRG